jgi:competence CoiA-like predicted nuclease
MPLKAIVNGNHFYSWTLAEEHRKLNFSCPYCKEKLVPVIPKQNIIKHFRHKTGTYHGEPESPEHEQGKQTLLNLLSHSGMKAEPEVKIGPNIADVFAEYGGDKIAIEFQCSTLTISDFFKRTARYLNARIPHMWILGGKYVKNAKTFYDWKDEKYQIQRITRLEKELMMVQTDLFYLDNDSFYVANWKTRYNANMLGWYNLRKIPNYVFVKTIREEMAG